MRRLRESLVTGRWAVIAAMAAVGLAGWDGGPALGAPPSATRASGKSAGAAPHHREPRLHFNCGDALDDGTVRDARQRGAFAALARGLGWGDDRPAPEGEPSGVRLICGPDLDGDGDKEAIVVVSFPAAKDVSDDVSSLAAPASNTYTLLASKRAAAWRAVAPIAFDVSDDPEGEPETVFVRHGRGVVAIEVEHRSFASSGCRIITYELFALLSGALQRLEVGDRSVPCAPCGCDPR